MHHWSNWGSELKWSLLNLKQAKYQWDELNETEKSIAPWQGWHILKEYVYVPRALSCLKLLQPMVRWHNTFCGAVSITSLVLTCRKPSMLMATAHVLVSVSEGTKHQGGNGASHASPLTLSITKHNHHSEDFSKTSCSGEQQQQFCIWGQIRQ